MLGLSTSTIISRAFTCGSAQDIADIVDHAPRHVPGFQKFDPVTYGVLPDNFIDDHGQFVAIVDPQAWRSKPGILE
jgi:hypothetical protein